jgi:hypothetical protein
MGSSENVPEDTVWLEAEIADSWRKSVYNEQCHNFFV